MLSLFVPYFNCFWYLKRVMLRDNGISRESSLLFLKQHLRCKMFEYVWGVLLFILWGDLFYVLPCVIFCSCVFSVLLALQLPRFGKRELFLVLFVRLFVCACLFSSVSSFSWFLGRAAVCDCGTPWTFLLLFVSLANVLWFTWYPMSSRGLFLRRILSYVKHRMCFEEQWLHITTWSYFV